MGSRLRGNDDEVEHQRGARTVSIAAAAANSAASPCSKPVTCRPSGSPPTWNSGSDTAGTPSSENGTANAASPVQPRPTGAGPGADRVMQASHADASAA